MRSILRFFWVVPVLALGGGLFSGSADETGSPTKGTVLILRKTECAMEGEIDRKRDRNGGDRYVLRHGLSTMEFHAAEVLHLCQNCDDAYQFMKSRIQLNNPDELLRLARWCDRND